jgi:hypothetical protein
LTNSSDEEKKRLDDKKIKRCLEKVFTNDRDNPEAWGATAGNLRIAADVLFQACRESWQNDEPIHPENQPLDSPATMLYGYAMENAIKGYLIKKHGGAEHDGFEKAKAANKEAWSHEISKLAEATGLPLTSEQKLLLESLESFIRWAGRYPIPLHQDQFTIPKQFHAGDDMTPNQIEPDGIQILEPFYKRLLDDISADLRKSFGDLNLAASVPVQGPPPQSRPTPAPPARQ